MTQTMQGRGATPRPADYLNPPQRTQLTRYPAVFCSLLLPAGGRTRCGIVTEDCPYCGGRHIHYARDADNAAGVKRAGCRRGNYWIVIARRYTPRHTAVAA